MPKTHLVVTTPCYDGVTPGYMISVMKLKDACQVRGIEFTCRLLPQVALVPLARAKLAADFLGFADATHMLSVDSDIGFEPEQALRLLDFGADFVGGAYPAKRINWGKVSTAVKEGRADLDCAALDYVVAWRSLNGLEAHRGFTRVNAVAGGFSLVRRSVVERLCEAHPELAFTRDPEPGEAGPRRAWALYDTMISPEGRYIGEDYAFCRRWTDLGGEIWLDMQSKLAHTGGYTFRGDLASQFRPAYSK